MQVTVLLMHSGSMDDHQPTPISSDQPEEDTEIQNDAGAGVGNEASDSDEARSVESLLDGSEEFIDEANRPVATVLDFWRWANSDLKNNALRGILAEFLVGRALRSNFDTWRLEWDAWDLVTPEGIKVEVKSSGYWQTWKNTKPSTIKFGVGRQLSWAARTNQYAETRGRTADVYVFCVLGDPKNPDTNPLKLEEWKFFVAATSRIDEVLGGQKTIVLSELERRVRPRHVRYDELREAVLAEADNSESFKIGGK